MTNVFGVGHNSGARIDIDEKDIPSVKGGIVAESLGQYVARIERLGEEKAAIAEDIKQVYQEAKSTGFDVKILRKVIANRKRNPNDLAEERELLELYEGQLLRAITE